MFLKKDKELIYFLMFNISRIITLLVILFSMFDGVFGQDFEKNKLYVYAAFGLYILGMALLKNFQWSIYVEIVAIGLMLFLLKEPLLLFLLIFPIVKSFVSETELYNVFIFPSVIVGLVLFIYGFDVFLFNIMIGVGLLIFVVEFEIIQYKKENRRLQKMVLKLEKTSSENVTEIVTKDKEIESISKMFVRFKKLNEKELTIEGLIMDLIFSSKATFDAECVVLYLLNEQGKYSIFKKIVDNDRYNIPKFIHYSEGRNPIVSGRLIRVPILFEKKPWGVISVYGKRDEVANTGQKLLTNFQEEDYEILALYSEQVMFKMSNAKLLEEMKDLANNDFLTKIPNRRYFMNRFEKFLKRAEKGDELALIVLDIDHFKHFNDTYGHDKGDEVLISVAEVLQEYVRPGDIVGRLGGEEFGILIPKANKEALVIAERLRKKISLIPSVEQITISLGLSYYGKDGKNTDVLYKNADVALYHSKENGRNRVSEFHEDMLKKQ